MTKSKDDELVLNWDDEEAGEENQEAESPPISLKMDKKQDSIDIDKDSESD